MATHFEVSLGGGDEGYCRQAAQEAFREAQRLEGELSRFVESSDISRANRLSFGQTIPIGEAAMECLLVAAGVCVATQGAFDPAFASVPPEGGSRRDPPFSLDPDAHTLTSRALRLRLDLGAVGKGFALDRMARVLRDWGLCSACLNAGSSSVLALDPPEGSAGWPVAVGEGASRRVLSLRRRSVSGSGVAVKGSHLVDPGTGSPALRPGRAWAFAPDAAVSDALSTAFYVMTDAAVERFCAENGGIGAALDLPGAGFAVHGDTAPWANA